MREGGGMEGGRKERRRVCTTDAHHYVAKVCNSLHLIILNHLFNFYLIKVPIFTPVSKPLL